MLRERAYLLVLFLSLTHFGALCQTSYSQLQARRLCSGWGLIGGFIPTLSTRYFVVAQNDKEDSCVDQEEGEKPKDVCQKAHSLAVFFDAGKLFMSRLFLSIVFGSCIQRYSTIYGRKPFLLLALLNALIPPVLLLLHLQANLPFYW